MAATTAASEGWRVTYLGPDLPAEDIAVAAREGGARAVALSIVYPKDGQALAEQLRVLRRELPAATAIIVGGQGAVAYRSIVAEIDAVDLPDLVALRAMLAELS